MFAQRTPTAILVTFSGYCQCYLDSIYENDSIDEQSIYENDSIDEHNFAHNFEPTQDIEQMVPVLSLPSATSITAINALQGPWVDNLIC
eukprot:2509534-Amphidinium_carterae.1